MKGFLKLSTDPLMKAGLDSLTSLKSLKTPKALTYSPYNPNYRSLKSAFQKKE